MATKQHGPVRLVWEKVSDDEWHAGGMTHLFSIIKNDAGGYSMRLRVGDNESTRIGVFFDLKQAQFRAQRILDQAQ